MPSAVNYGSWTPHAENDYYQEELAFDPIAEEERRQQLAEARLAHISTTIRQPPKSFSECVTEIKNKYFQSPATTDIPKELIPQIGRINADFVKLLGSVAIPGNRFNAQYAESLNPNRQGGKQAIFNRSRLIKILEKFLSDSPEQIEAVRSNLSAIIAILKHNSVGTDATKGQIKNDYLSEDEQHDLRLRLDQVAKDWQDWLDNRLSELVVKSEGAARVVEDWRAAKSKTAESFWFWDFLWRKNEASRLKVLAKQAQTRLNKFSEEWDTLQSSQYALRMVKHVARVSKLESQRISQIPATAAIAATEQKNWRLGYKEDVLRNAHVGVGFGVDVADWVGASVSLNATLGKNNYKFMDPEGSMVIYDDWLTIGASVGGKASIGVAKAASDLSAQVTVDGDYCEYITPDALARLEFHTHIKDSVHRDNPEVANRLSSTKFLLSNPYISGAINKTADNVEQNLPENPTKVNRDPVVLLEEKQSAESEDQLLIEAQDDRIEPAAEVGDDGAKNAGKGTANKTENKPEKSAALTLKEELLAIAQDEIAELDALKKEYDQFIEFIEPQIELYMSKKLDTTAYKQAYEQGTNNQVSAEDEQKELRLKKQKRLNEEHTKKNKDDPDPYPMEKPLPADTIGDFKHEEIKTPDRVTGGIRAKVKCVQGKLSGSGKVGLDEPLLGDQLLDNLPEPLEMGEKASKDVLSGSATGSAQIRNRTFKVAKATEYCTRYLDALKAHRTTRPEASPWWWLLPRELWPGSWNDEVPAETNENKVLKAEMADRFATIKEQLISSTNPKAKRKKDPDTLVAMPVVVKKERQAAPVINSQGLAVFNIAKTIQKLPETVKFHKLYKIKELLAEQGLTKVTVPKVKAYLMKKGIDIESAEDWSKLNETSIKNVLRQSLEKKGIALTSAGMDQLFDQKMKEVTQKFPVTREQILESKNAYLKFIEGGDYGDNAFDLWHDVCSVCNKKDDEVRIETIRADKEKYVTQKKPDFNSNTVADRIKCFEYLRKEFAKYKSLHASVTNGMQANYQEEDPKRLLRKFEKRYGASKPEELLHRFVVANFYLLTQLDGESIDTDPTLIQYLREQKIDKTPKAYIASLKNDIKAFGISLVNPPFAVNKNYLNEKCKFVEDIDFRGVEIRFEIEAKAAATVGLSIEPLKLKAEVALRWQTHTILGRRGFFIDISGVIGGSGNINSLLESVAPQLLRQIPAQDAADTLSALGEYLEGVSPIGSFGVERNFTLHKFRLDKLTDQPDAQGFSLSNGYVRTLEKLSHEVGLSLSIPTGLGFNVNGGFKLSSATTTRIKETIFADTWGYLIMLYMHDHIDGTVKVKTGVLDNHDDWVNYKGHTGAHEIGHTIALEEAHPDDYRQLFTKYATELKEHTDTGKLGKLAHELDEWGKAIEAERVLKEPSAIAEFRLSTEKTTITDKDGTRTVDVPPITISQEFRRAKAAFDTAVIALKDAGRAANDDIEFTAAKKAFRVMLHAIYPFWHVHRHNTPLASRRPAANVV